MATIQCTKCQDGTSLVASLEGYAMYSCNACGLSHAL